MSLEKSILLVNGSEVLMSITQKILVRAGYSVKCALGISGALEQLVDYSPDMIIIGDDLPDGSGLELCDRLRKESPVPIMFTSGSKEDELPALRAGASDFLKRPFDYEVFKARISVLLNKRIDISPDMLQGEGEATIGSERDSEEKEPLDDGFPVKNELRRSARFRFVFAAACFLTALILFGIFYILISSQNITEIPNTEIPLTEFTSPD